MITRGFHAWERRLASIDTNRVVRPFEWGLDWLALGDTDGRPAARFTDWSRAIMSAPEEFFDAGTTTDYQLDGNVLRFPSAIRTPYPVNDIVSARIFPARQSKAGQPRRAIVVMPQWNADPESHVGLCRLFAHFGLTAARLSMPYHDQRRPAELERADYIVSSNIGRTVHANRQAVLDARRTIDWLVSQGYERIGVMGTSLGSCLAMLTLAHDPRVRAGGFNHVSPYFADVVWHGISTRHVRAGFDGHLTLDELREFWMPISPSPFIEQVRGRSVLLIYARYDLTFPVNLSQQLLDEFRRLDVPHHVATLPCGHYTTGKAPFKYLDGYYLTRFFLEKL